MTMKHQTAVTPLLLPVFDKVIEDENTSFYLTRHCKDVDLVEDVCAFADNFFEKRIGELNVCVLNPPHIDRPDDFIELKAKLRSTRAYSADIYRTDIPNILYNFCFVAR